MPVIGILDPGVTFIFDAFVQGMRDLGYVEGQNISYARRSLKGRPESIQALANDLVGLNVNVIVTVATGPVRAVRQATTTIPTIFLVHGDPVGAGDIASLSRPGGNITGLSFLNDELSAKRLEILRDTLPSIRSVAVFYDPTIAVQVRVRNASRITFVSANTLTFVMAMGQRSNAGGNSYS